VRRQRDGIRTHTTLRTCRMLMLGLRREVAEIKTIEESQENVLSLSCADGFVCVFADGSYA
jgi:hypothetical protein